MAISELVIKMKALRFVLTVSTLVVVFYLGKITSSSPYRPAYVFAEPNYLNFHYWRYGEGRYALRDVLEKSGYKFERICASGEGGAPPYEVDNGKMKLVAGVELNDALSMSYVSLYLVGAGVYSVMNFDPLEFGIDWSFSDCQPIDKLSVEVSKSGVFGNSITYKFN